MKWTFLDLQVSGLPNSPTMAQYPQSLWDRKKYLPWSIYLRWTSLSFCESFMSMHQLQFMAFAAAEQR